jgi:hypothetical protein
VVNSHTLYRLSYKGNKTDTTPHHTTPLRIFGIEPKTSALSAQRATNCAISAFVLSISYNKKMREAGFEPAHPEIVGLKSTALDHSAIRAHHFYFYFYFLGGSTHSSVSYSRISL